MRRLRLAAALTVAVGLATACSSGGGDAGQTRGADGVSIAAEVAEVTVHLPGGAGDSLDFGSRLAIADVTGDGIGDLLIGAPGADGPANDRPDAGAVYVVKGGDMPDEVSLPDDAILVIYGAQAGDNLGFAVAAGDLNGDGTADVIAGAIGSNGLENLRTDMGEAFVFFGGEGLAGKRDLLDSEHDFLLQPAEGFSHLGTSFATGDVNGDRIDDLIAGAPYAGRPAGSPVGSPRTTVGEVYVVFGRSDLHGTARVAEGDEDVMLSGVREFDQFGTSVAVSDLDGDGLGDIIIGAPGYEKEGGPEDGGAALVFIGRASFPERMDADAADFRVLAGSPGAGLGDSVASGDVYGDGRAEILAGAPTAGTAERAGSGALVAIDFGTGSVIADVSGAGSTIGASSGDFFPASLMAGSGGPPGSMIGGSPSADGGAGAVYVLNEARGTAIDLASPPPGSKVMRGRSGEGLGAAIAAGDIDGDGRTELAVMAAGTPGETEEEPGAVYVLSP